MNMALVRQEDPISGEVTFVDEDTGKGLTVSRDQGYIKDLIELGKQGLTAYQTFQLNQINVERARMGLPPIDVSQYTGVGVRVGLAPQTQQLLIYGGLALLAVMVFNTLARRR
jgi:hypothetical protein